MITMQLLPIHLSVCYPKDGNPKIKIIWLKRFFPRKNQPLALCHGACQCPHKVPLNLSWAQGGEDPQPVKKHSYTALQVARFSAALSLLQWSTDPTFFPTDRLPLITLNHLLLVFVSLRISSSNSC